MRYTDTRPRPCHDQIVGSFCEVCKSLPFPPIMPSTSNPPHSSRASVVMLERDFSEGSPCDSEYAGDDP